MDEKMDKYKLLVINPGSTSTKVAVYQNEEEIFMSTVRHPIEEISHYATIYDQYDFREKIRRNIQYSQYLTPDFYNHIILHTLKTQN